MDRMSTTGFIKNSQSAYLRFSVIRTILQNLKEEGYISNLGKCLDIGCSAGQGCFALKREGANEVYGIDNMRDQLDLAIELGFLDNEHAVDSKMEKLIESYKKGFFGESFFDTITIFCYPYLPLEVQNKKLDSIHCELQKSWQKISELDLSINLDVSDSFHMDNGMRRRVDEPLEQMLSVLNPSGIIVLSTYPNDYVSKAFSKLSLNCRSYLVPEGLEPERIVYIGSR